MTDQFDGPGSVSGIEWGDLNGRLLLITPHEVIPEFKTVHGTGPTVRADLVVLDGPGAPQEYRDTLIFPKVLQGQVRSNAGSGRMNLGRLGLGEKKPGQSAPWMLGDPTETDKDAARQFLHQANKPPF